MVIYNVTVNIEEQSEKEWLHWMQTEHIPEMLQLEMFLKAKLTKVRVEEEMGGVTYSIQYTATDQKGLDQYYREHAEVLRSKNHKFAGKFVAFRTELEVIGEFVKPH
ncbi:DUF4286 family protein [Aquimarina sp. ERC-38]|uniref:DUF4286 family protein n=1 Tax=Aquimarina sp. ERC-38 TaxID=2949996 RepID=UPI0022465901|nr:DUF4286 family protein [Aquimarina sp. ERC-38]UZO81344.1 DUF4286 family protein [Aquimarina sp. ERC-38]